jgi:hypothetical protein
MLRAVLPSLLRLVHPLRDLLYLVIPGLTLLGSVYPPVLPGFLIPGSTLTGYTRYRHTKPYGILHFASLCLVQPSFAKYRPEGLYLS